MIQVSTVEPTPPCIQCSADGRAPLLRIVEAHAPRGEWISPAVSEVRLAMTLADFSGSSWHGSRFLASGNVSAGTTAICKLNQAHRFELRNSTSFAIVLLQKEVLEQTLGDKRRVPLELRPLQTLQDEIMRNLMEVLLYEMRGGFRNGAFFLDGVATALVSHLVRHYAVNVPRARESSGGMAPSVLRRSVELMEAKLEGELRLVELAREAGLSTSHFVRSFRQSTGRTPYQFLLHRRVKRAQNLMRDRRVSLTEVALASGFADQHHLARIFRRVTGITPSDYRRSL
jgi:AraC family transcriptional regulator